MGRISQYFVSFYFRHAEGWQNRRKTTEPSPPVSLIMIENDINRWLKMFSTPLFIHR